MTYKELLKDDRWKKLSAKIKRRDGGKCVLCDSRRSLNVHHKRYVGKPWEAKDSDLITLCSKCHAIHHGKRKNKERKVRKDKPTKKTRMTKETQKTCQALEGAGFVRDKDFFISNCSSIKLKAIGVGKMKKKLMYYPKSGTLQVAMSGGATRTKGVGIPKLVREYSKMRKQ